MSAQWARRRAKLKKAWPGRALLWCLSMVYGAAVVMRRWLYEAGILPARRLQAKVVCVGNLTTGGTGKTPAVLLAATTLRKRSHPVAILSRGYGRRTKNGEITTLLDDNPPPWTECGDEPWMMHQALFGQNVPILVSPDRTKAGHEAETFYHSRVIILDDGFQHLKLHHDLDIVLVNARDPFGGGSLLPLGNLREPISALSRAHLVVITHADMVDENTLEGIRAQIQAVNPRIPILEAAHRADFLLDVRTEKRRKLDSIEGKKIVALSGIADPVQFEEQLASIGAKVAQRWRYPDHHAYRARELRSLEAVRHGLPVVTTFKDFIRFPKDWQRLLADEVLVLSIKLEILKGRNIWIDSLLNIAGDAPVLPA
ncbi:MAG: tetraacyldisaccharide 4'-kinase [Elusimicrobia bacterium]|nr:tetraacyldisaccharide 4'-kinase [Elusimicrobiota bacterium]